MNGGGSIESETTMEDVEVEEQVEEQHSGVVDDREGGYEELLDDEAEEDEGVVEFDVI